MHESREGLVRLWSQDLNATLKDLDDVQKVMVQSPKTLFRGAPGHVFVSENPH